MGAVARPSERIVQQPEVGKVVVETRHDAVVGSNSGEAITAPTPVPLQGPLRAAQQTCGNG